MSVFSGMKGTVVPVRQVERGLRRMGSAVRPRVARPAAVAATGFLLVYGAWQVFRWGGAEQQRLIGDLAFVPVIALAVVACWAASRRCAAVGRMAQAWALIGLAVAAWGAGGGVQLVYEISGGFASPSLADPLYLAFYPLFLAGIVQLPRRRHVMRNARTALDAATVAIGGAAALWYLTLGPATFGDSGNVLSGIVTLAYPAGDLVLIVALARLSTEAHAGVPRRSLGLLGAGLGLFVVADVWYGWAVANDAYAGGDLVDGIWLLAIIAMAFAALGQPTLTSADVDEEEMPAVAGATALTGGMAVAPYIAVVTVFVLLVVSQAGDAFFPGLSLTLVAVVVGLLVVVRQALSQRDLVATLRQLRRAHAELAAIATTDPLTGLPNHRAVAVAIDQELERSKRFDRTCGLLFIDIDYFKALNDSHGHAAGDAVLHEIGAALRAALRTMDTVGRWGGEEFVVVLPEIDPQNLLAAAERVRHRIAEHRFGALTDVHVTVSVGCASYPDDGTTRGQLLDAADRAMYTAKRMGRNQAFAASDPAVLSLATLGGADRPPDERTMMCAVDALAMLVDARDKGTGTHTEHVANLAQQVALRLGCTPQQASEVHLAAKLHDIGKVAVADSVLRKPGRLTDEEWDLMRRHPVIGADVVARIGRLATLAPIIRAHHERYDGAGYPDGLAGNEIPLAARIVGAADAFDAMISDRPYRRGMSIELARDELRRCAGTQFDPAVIAALEHILDEPRDQAA